MFILSYFFCCYGFIHGGFSKIYSKGATEYLYVPTLKSKETVTTIQEEPNGTEFYLESLNNGSGSFIIPLEPGDRDGFTLDMSWNTRLLTIHERHNGPNQTFHLKLNANGSFRIEVLGGCLTFLIGRGFRALTCIDDGNDGSVNQEYKIDFDRKPDKVNKDEISSIVSGFQVLDNINQKYENDNLVLNNLPDFDKGHNNWNGNDSSGNHNYEIDHNKGPTWLDNDKNNSGDYHNGGLGRTNQAEIKVVCNMCNRLRNLRFSDREPTEEERLSCNLCELLRNGGRSDNENDSLGNSGQDLITGPKNHFEPKKDIVLEEIR